MSMGIVLRQFLSNRCQFLSISGILVVVEICCSYLLWLLSWAIVYVNFPIDQSTIHYRSMLLLTTTILRCPSELSNGLISLRSNWLVLSNYISVLLRCASTTLQSATRIEQNTACGWMMMNIPAVGGTGVLAMDMVLTICVALHTN